MRLFIAAELPENIKEGLCVLQKKLPEATLRLVKKQHMHLTLKFLEEASPAKAEHIRKALSKVKFSPLDINVFSLGVFRSGRFIRVVWAGLQPENNIICLQKQIDEALQKMFPKDKKFSAHLTLARAKFVKNNDKFIEELEKIRIAPLGFEIRSFALKKSTLTPQGPVYETLAVFPA